VLAAVRAGVRGRCAGEGDLVTELRIPKPARRGPAPRRPIRRRVSPAAKRRAAKAAGWVDPDSWQAVLEFYAYLCAYCGDVAWEQQDHCLPLSRGGAHHISNVVPACAGCNYAKGTQAWVPHLRHPFMEAA
jgi:5-methylcytosine-specific restriction endonuclease McrA